MAVTIKSEKQIALMREAGHRLALLHEKLGEAICPGMSTLDIDRLGEELIRDMGCTPNFKNYQGYPASICVSVNNEVVHGIPSRSRILKEGDIVSLDAGLIYKGYHSDAARTWGVGEISEEARKLIDVTEKSFFKGIAYAKAGCNLTEVSAAIQDYVEGNGFSVVRDLVGHGIGTRLHEDPEVPNFRRRGSSLKLKAGMTLAIEPMVNAGDPDVECLEDGWTIITQDGSLAAHYENTILIKEGECEILSLICREGTV